METSAGIQASLAGRYASALFDLASENGTVTAVEGDLESLGAALAESAELVAATTNPELSRAQQADAVAAGAKQPQTSHPPPQFFGVVPSKRERERLGVGKEVEFGGRRVL